MANQVGTDVYGYPSLENIWLKGVYKLAFHSIHVCKSMYDVPRSTHLVLIYIIFVSHYCTCRAYFYTSDFLRDTEITDCVITYPDD